MGLIIGGLIIAAIGIIVVVKGNIPFIKTYHGIVPGKEKLHCRIEGSILTFAGCIFIIYNYLRFPSSTLIVLILLASVLGVGLEIVLKVFK
ncbi:MAG: hypothetical protein ACRC3H_00870 [Lachnospiraceae bacterium]